MNITVHKTTDAEGFIPAPNNNGKPITVIGTDAIRDNFDETCLQQALNSRGAPGVTDLVLNPDAHAGYGAPVGCVMVSPTHIYPGPVGVDIKCSMSLLQLDLPEDAITDKPTRRALINAIVERTPTGAGQGQRSAKKSRRVSRELGFQAVTEGASRAVCEQLGIRRNGPSVAKTRPTACHQTSVPALSGFLPRTVSGISRTRCSSLGSYGGGNHFGECEVVHLSDRPSVQEAAETFGLRDKHVAFLSHCGSRGFGNLLAQGQFRDLSTNSAPGHAVPGRRSPTRLCPARNSGGGCLSRRYVPGRELCHGEPPAHQCPRAGSLPGNPPGRDGKAGLFHQPQHCPRGNHRWPEVVGPPQGCHSRHPGGHFSLAGTPFAETGHPILLPGNPRDGSVVMVAQAGRKSPAIP